MQNEREARLPHSGPGPLPLRRRPDPPPAKFRVLNGRKGEGRPGSRAYPPHSPGLRNTPASPQSARGRLLETKISIVFRHPPQRWCVFSRARLRPTKTPPQETGSLPIGGGLCPGLRPPEYGRGRHQACKAPRQPHRHGATIPGFSKSDLRNQENHVRASGVQTDPAEHWPKQTRHGLMPQDGLRDVFLPERQCAPVLLPAAQECGDGPHGFSLSPHPALLFWRPHPA